MLRYIHPTALALILSSSALTTTDLMAENPSSLVDQQTDALIKSNKIINIDNKAHQTSPEEMDSLYTEISKFYYNQFRHFSDPAAPYFLFMSKDSKLIMGVGGTVCIRGYYEWGGAINDIGFTPALIPMNPSPTDMRHFGTSPSGSGLFFRVLGQNNTIGEYQVYIEANFNGYKGRDFHLKHAYAMIRDFTIGYTTSTFSDPSALPPTVDDAGPNIKMSPKRVLVRYMPKIKKRWTFAVSAETPSSQITADDVATSAVSDWLPDFAAFIQYSWRRSEHIRLAAIIRTLSYRDLKESQNHNIAGWGVQLSSVARPLPQITTYATVSYGQGYSSLGGDLSYGDYDLIPDPLKDGRMYAPKSWGYCLGLQYNFRPNLFSSVTFSQSRFLPSKPIAGTEYKYGLYGAVNVFWNVTPRIQLGAEIDLGSRKDFNHQHRTAKRGVAMAQFSF